MVHIVGFEVGKGGAKVSNGRGEFIGNGVGGVGIGEAWEDRGGVWGGSGGAIVSLLGVTCAFAFSLGGGCGVWSGGGRGMFSLGGGYVADVESEMDTFFYGMKGVVKVRAEDRGALDKALGGVTGVMLLSNGRGEGVDSSFGYGGLLDKVGILALQVVYTTDSGKVVGVVFLSDVTGSMRKVPLIWFCQWRWSGGIRVGRGGSWEAMPFSLEFHGERRE